MSRFLIALALCALASPASAETAYLRLIDDVPLPQSYSESDEAVVFEGAEGRIIQASAAGSGSGGSALAFYQATLPALGWASAPGADGGLSFQRGRERLSIEAPDNSAIRFRLVSGASP